MDESQGLDYHLMGQVEWRFRCEWGPSADDVTTSESSHYVPRPWWVPGPRHKDKDKGRVTAEDDNGTDLSMDPETDSDSESTIQYRILRKLHPNYRHRRIPLSESHQSVLPQHVRAPYSVNMPDGAFALGWLCKDCGKLNYRAMLRHQMCTSSFCKVSDDLGVISTPTNAERLG